MKDSLDIKMILQAGFFRSVRKLGLHNPRVHLNSDTFKLAQLEHREINEIKTKLKLKKDNIQRCFELLLLACLSQHDHYVHEAYRKSVLKKFAETRTLLLPYFKFENFADRSMFTIVDKLVYQQPQRVRKKCCFGDGQLTCLIGRARHGQQVKSEVPSQHDSLTGKLNGIKGNQSDFTGRNCRSEHNFGQHSNHEGLLGNKGEDFPQERAAKQIANFELSSGALGTAGLLNLRNSRYQGTQWHEMQGQQVRYILPPTLVAKIRQALTSTLSPA